jgi:hypothetical protein
LRPFKDHADDHRHVIGSPLGRTSGGPYPLPVSVRGPLGPPFRFNFKEPQLPRALWGPGK